MQSKLINLSRFAFFSFKKISILILSLCFSSAITAQKKKDKNQNLPDFGKIEKADLEMKECNFDAKAEAMILLDDGLLEFAIPSGMELKRRVRIKILNNKGLDWANVHLPYKTDGSRQNITDIEAQTYNVDANGNIVTIKVDKSLIYNKKINKKISERVFTFPDVKVGSVIEYRFKHYGIGLIDWYFQRSIPVRYSHFITDFPNEIEVSSIPFCVNKYEYTSEQNWRNVKKYSMSNIPAFRDEPFILNEDYYRDRLETKVTAFNINGKRENRLVNWVQVIKYLMEDEDFGVQIKKNIPRTADLDEKLKTVTGPYEKMKTVYKYVQDNMEWNEYTGIWALDGVKSAWKDKKGTAGEINLILVNLLKDAGLNVHPILVSSHDNGIVNAADAGTYESPGFLQFNKVLAYVNINDAIYVLDATQKNNPVNLIPADVLLTEGLVIEKIDTYEWGWKTLWKDDLVAKNIVFIKGEIDEKRKLKGEASILSYDYARLSRLPAAKKGKDKYLEKFITESNPGIMVNEVTFENLESDSLPLIQKLKFDESLNKAGEYAYFSTNILTGLEKNPFVADNRFSDVFFGYKQHYTILGTYTIPEGFELGELPKNIKMIMPDTSITISRVSQVTQNTLQTKIELKFQKPVYTAEEYAFLQEFYQRLFELLNEQFVVRKKK